MKLAEILRRLEALLPSDGDELDGGAPAYAWSMSPLGGQLTPLPETAGDRADDLVGLAEQAAALRANTLAFAEGRPAHHALLSGPRGCGKSTLARAVLGEFLGERLRVISTDAAGILALGQIRRLVAGRPHKYVVLCDDLAFSEPRESFRALKAAMDGGMAPAGRGPLVYATSNRRRLIPETMRENLEATHSADGELHPGEAAEEKTALADRFGLWLPVFAPQEDAYLEIARHWLDKFGVQWSDSLREQALRWSMDKGSRNGRTALQFAVDCAQRGA